MITVRVPDAKTWAASIVLDYSADDGAGSGAASLKSTLDGSDTTNGQSITGLTKGSHTFVATAKDNLGNIQTSTVGFTVQ